MDNPVQASARPTVLQVFWPLCVLAGSFLAVSAKAPASDTDMEIEYLLSVVAQSDCTFVRNGDAHSGQEAVAHMRKKFDHFSKRITSAESFIEYSATKSLVSGKNYSVDCPGYDPQPTGQWLLEKLDAYRKRQVPPPGKAI